MIVVLFFMHNNAFAFYFTFCAITFFIIFYNNYNQKSMNFKLETKNTQKQEIKLELLALACSYQ